MHSERERLAEQHKSKTKDQAKTHKEQLSGMKRKQSEISQLSAAKIKNQKSKKSKSTCWKKKMPDSKRR